MKKYALTRRDLMKSFGALSFVLFPVARSMGYIQGGTFQNAPRFVMFFKGPAYQSPSVQPATINDLAGTPLAPMASHKDSLILFRGMHTTGGNSLGDVYEEEHAGGLFGCVTGNDYHYYESDSYMAYTDHESFDVMLAGSYKSRPALAALPFASLHLGAGAQSDCDSCGLGQKYISFKKTARSPGSSDYYDNAIEPVQNAGQVYDSLMQRIQLVCSDGSNQPGTDNTKLLEALRRRKSVLDFRLDDIARAKSALGMDSEHARKLDALLEGWRETEVSLDAQIAQAESGGGGGTTEVCPDPDRPTGNGNGENDLDDLSVVHDQMIGLIRLAFEWDLTRVVAFTLSGASSGQRWSSQGITQAHHSLEHDGDTEQLNVIDSYFSEKYASLLTELSAIDDGNGENGLYNSVVLLGQECWSDGGHSLRDIPYVVAGNAAGAFDTGRVVSAGGRSNNDLMISIQNACGISSSTWGRADLCDGPII